MKPPLRILLTVLVFALALAICAPLIFLAAMLLAGPHAGLLPQPLEVTVLLCGWLALILLPTLAARALWRQLGRQPG